MRPRVSIILPTYDRLPFLREAVESVRAQTMPDWELIVVDDGSSDESLAWIATLNDPRIVTIAEPHTGNVSRARNVGLARANADWVAFLDSDDRWAAVKLERQLAYHEANPRFPWSYTGRRLIDADGDPLPDGQFKPWHAHSGRILERVLVHEANIALPSVIVRRSLLRDVGGFNEGFIRAHDYELWVRLAERFECGVLDEPLLDVRKHKLTSFQLPDVSLGFVKIYRDFQGRSSDPRLCEIARTREAYSAVDALERLGIQQQWSDAHSALLIAMQARPFGPFVYRAAARLARRHVRAFIVGPLGTATSSCRRAPVAGNTFE